MTVSSSLQCDQQQLGNMYSVLSKRRGRVIDEDLVEGTQVRHPLTPLELFGVLHVGPLTRGRTDV